MNYKNKKTIELSELTLDSSAFSAFAKRPFYITTVTSKFQEFTRKYHLSKPVESLGPKIFHGQVLRFENLAQFSAGHISTAFPLESDPRHCYCGIAIHDGTIMVASKNHIEIFNESLQKIDEFYHPLFNDLHSLEINPSRESLLIASSGIDHILEFDIRNRNLLWKWSAYDISEINTERKLLSNLQDFSSLHISTAVQLSHINTASYLNNTGNLIGATLFHQGKACVINRNNNSIHFVETKMLNPHGFARFGSNSYVVTDTKNGKIYFLDKNMEIYLEIRNISRVAHPIWIQNTFPISDSQVVVLNQNECELILIDIIKFSYIRIPHNPDWKIYQIYLM